MPYTYSLTSKIPASAQDVYDAWLDSLAHSDMTGGAAQMSKTIGAEVSAWDGYISGRNLELVPGERIVQAWRPTHWDPGVYSIVHFELKAASGGTALVLDHTGFPEGEFDHLDPGWYLRYWDPLKKYLAAHE